MKIETREVMNGLRDGEQVWICHYLRPDLDKKPLRNVPPTLVQVVNNSSLPKNKRVYYSASHFLPVAKNGSLKSTVISPVDNTGYRSMSGNPLNVFDSEQECIECWNEELSEVMRRLDDMIANSQAAWQHQKNETFSLKR